MAKARRRIPNRGRRRWPARLAAALALVAALMGGLVAAVRGGWLGGGVAADGTALARLELPRLGGRLVSVSVTDGAGKPLPVRLEGSRLWPRRPVAQGEHVSIDVRFSRPRPLQWLFGSGGHTHLPLVTPETELAGGMLRFAAGKPVVLRFREPVQVVTLRLGGRRVRRDFDAPRTSVTTGLTADRRNGSGEAVVAAAPRRWERLTRPARVRWFPPGAGVMVQAAPRYDGALHPLQQLRLIFSEPVATVLGTRLPRVSPRTPGSWQHADDHTLVFQPGARGFPLAATVTVTLPADVQAVTGGTVAASGRKLQWQVVGGSTLRLQQLLAQLGYLPLSWTPAGSAADSRAAQLRAALRPPVGSFRWRYPNVPPQLARLWRPGRPNVLTKAAVFAFQYQHGLQEDGNAGATVWKALLADAAAGTRASGSGYSYVLVDRTEPQTLSLWRDGRTLLRSRVNAGTPDTPAPLGSYPIWQRRTMEPGTAAGDPGGRWLAYYHGGDSLHSSHRRSYGRAQSAGGIELPARIAYRLWPYTTIGTIVTVTDLTAATRSAAPT